ncbi:MAG: HPP family protein [Proteobacteria bacterium]|nr:HPP family protein [Pseudomonadota bacterium]
MNFIKKLGVGGDATGHIEKVISAVGGFIGILLTMWVSGHYLGMQGAALLVASMGASAVLLFAVPNGALSQPWPLMGGHVISALIGVSCAQGISNVLIAAPLAVALAIGAMHYLRCIHPPGGATAISAVIGGAQVHALGFQYVLTPVLLNAVIMLTMAIVVNYAFPWRRYPASLRKAVVAAKTPENYSQLSHADFVYALAETGSYVDISEDELLKIYRLAFKHAWQLSDLPEQIAVGLYYSNGEPGADLSVRKVVALGEPGAEVTYKIVAGYGQGAIKTATLVDFTNWQRYEVILKEGSWHRIRQVNMDNPN